MAKRIERPDIDEIGYLDIKPNDLVYIGDGQFGIPRTVQYQDFVVPPFVRVIASS